MHHSEQINEISEAFAKAQGALKNPERNRSVEVRMKSGGTYEFSYATIDNIIDVARKPLADNGLSYVQELARHEDRLVMRTRLLHKSGQWIETETPVTPPSESSAQALGSVHTYFRRYALQELLGLSAEEDDDASTAEGNSVKDKPRSEADGWKERAERVKAQLANANTVADVDRIIKDSGTTLAEIKANSASAYDFLIEGSNKRKAALTQKAA